MRLLERPTEGMIFVDVADQAALLQTVGFGDTVRSRTKICYRRNF